MPDARPFKIRGIDHVVLRVVDLERSLHFYCDVLGCDVERRLDRIGLIQLRAGRTLIDLVPIEGELGRMGGAPPGQEGRNMDHLALAIDAFDENALRSFMAAQDVEASETGIRYGAEGDGPSIYITDPDGNTVELKGPAAPETPG